MAKLEMKVPSPGESISEVEIAAWLVADGDYVVKDQAIAEVESGTITLMAAEGDVVKVGQVVCLIDTSAAKPAGITTPEKEIESPKSASNAIPQPSPNPDPIIKADNYAAGTASPAASKLMAENKVLPNQVVASGKDGRITKQDVNNAIAKGFDNASISVWGGSREIRREKMSMLRRKIAERLVSVKNETAMLTTFNEVDMKPIMDLRAKYKDAFAKKHEVNLGFMSFFTKAVTEALNIYPAVNGQIQNGEIIYHQYADIGVAVSSPKGLMVPILRNAEQMSLAEIEREIKRLAIKARDGKITPDEMTGGTFTITNGGVFGSMLSTPIINPPQAAMLGMHNIVERPVVVDGQIVIRPIMYLALSYDHRIIDGRESVSFLVRLKQHLEDTARLLLDI